MREEIKVKVERIRSMQDQQRLTGARIVDGSMKQQRQEQVKQFDTFRNLLGAAAEIAEVAASRVEPDVWLGLSHRKKSFFKEDQMTFAPVESGWVLDQKSNQVTIDNTKGGSWPVPKHPSFSGTALLATGEFYHFRNSVEVGQQIKQVSTGGDFYNSLDSRWSLYDMSYDHFLSFQLTTPKIEYWKGKLTEFVLDNALETYL